MEDLTKFVEELLAIELIREKQDREKVEFLKDWLKEVKQ